MFQRLSNLLFGEVEEVVAELKGPNPCLTEADEEGWMIVNLPGECTLQPHQGAQVDQRRVGGSLGSLGRWGFYSWGHCDL